MSKQEKRSPKDIKIEELRMKEPIRRLLMDHGMKTAWDIAEFQNCYRLSSIDGIGDANLVYIGKTLQHATGMNLPPLDRLNDEPWEWYHRHRRIVKIFIAQPMSGLSDEEVLYERQEAMKKCLRYFEDDEYVAVHFLDQYYVKNAPKDANRLWYLGHSIEILSEADYIYFTDDWMKAKGCLVEAVIADKYQIKNLNIMMHGPDWNHQNVV